MDEDEKTKYAIRLTGCEIATADMPVPIECCGISSSMDKEPEDRRKPTSADITRCVQVPQLWTSYSGYFREVKVMCLAVRYSLEHEDLRNMQRNLTLSHAEQIALLREQRRELIETHRLETVRLQEILDIHSTITREVESMLSSAGTLRDTLGSIYNDVSRIARNSEQGAAQQSVALSNLQDMNNHIMAEYQENIQHTLGSVAQAIQTWHESLIAGLSRSQELDQLGENFVSRIIDSNEGLDAVMHKVNTAKNRLQDLTETVVEGTQSLLNLQDTAAKEMQASTNALSTSMIETLKSLESDSQDTWQSVFEALKTGSSNLHEEVSAALQETMSDVESMATSSQEKMEELNRIVSEFQAKQGDVIWQLQALHKTLKFFTGKHDNIP
ncbi:hypothetical protein BGZ58_005127 [Dissophora ornata]|nr:hypothetical protein BGZ58_005127 [Dissophora ornata]